MAARCVAIAEDRVRSTAFALCGNNSVWAECLFYSQEAGGSNPSSRTSLNKENEMFGTVVKREDAWFAPKKYGFESHRLHHCSTTGTIVRVMPA